MEQNRNSIFTKSDEELIKILARYWKVSEDVLKKPFKVIASFKKAEKKDINDREYGYFVDVRNLNGDILYYPQKRYGSIKVFSLLKNDYLANDIIMINVRLASRNQREKHNNPFMLKLENDDYEIPAIDLSDRIQKEKLIRKLFNDIGSTPKDAQIISNALRAIMGDLYTETERFVFELLQNADDQPNNGDSVNVMIKALKENLLFLHTGKPFRQADVESISSIGDSTKDKDTEKTGYKGIGFKSVFSDAETVYIDSGNFSFAFDRNSPVYPENENMDQVPWQIKPIWEERYRLPKEIQKENMYFHAPVGIALSVGSTKIENYNTIIPKLLSEPRFTLFLRNINKIYFSNLLGNSIVVTKDNKIDGTIVIESNGELEKWVSKDYLIDIPAEIRDSIQFDKQVPVKLKESTKTKITFAAKITDGAIEPISNAVLFNYLPTKEHSFGFTFLVNADFLTVSNRESIHFKNVWNRFLFTQIGRLLLDWVSSLSDYKGSLSLMPLKDDGAENILASDFFSSLNQSLMDTAFIRGYNGNMLALKDVMLDKSGLSQIIGKDLFCQIVDNQKSLPLYEQDEVALRNNELCTNVTAITTLVLLPKLTNNSLFKRWFVESDETAKGLFYDWLLKKNTEQRKASIVKLVSSLPIYKFGDNYLSKEEASESTNRIVIHNGHSALIPVYKACGIECSDNIDLLPISCFYSDSIIKSTFEYIFSHLRDNETFSKWIHTASEPDKKILEDWLDQQDTNAERHKILVKFVESIPIVVFKDKICKRGELIKRAQKPVTTYNQVIIVEVDELDSTRLIITNKLFPIVDLLTKIGFVCSANIQNSPFVKFFNLPKEIDLFNLINTKASDALKENGTLLTPAEKLSIFNVLKDLDGVNETNVAKNLLFWNQSHTHRRWLSTMTNYSSDIPTWIYEYTICEQENFPELKSYLIKKDRVFEEIVKKHIEEIITEVSPKEIYLHYKDQWSSDFTKTLITKYGATSAILEMIELQDKDSQKFFLQKVEKIELKAGDVCPLESYEIRVLKLAFNVYDDNEIRMFAEKLLFNGKAVSKVTYSDDVNLQYHENCILKLSLSDLLPEYKDSGMIQQVKCCLSNLGESNLNRLFTLVPMDINDINRKLDVSNGYTQTKFLFRLFYTRKYKGWSGNNVISINLSTVPAEWSHKLLDILFSQRVKLYQDSFGYRLSSYFSGYISNAYIMDSEKVPSFVENWADSEEKKVYLYEQGVGTEKKELIKFRKKIVNDEIVSETEVQEQSNSIISTLNYLIEKISLPLNGNNQRETLLKLFSICRNVTSQIDIDKLKNISEEYDLPEYLNWKSESVIKISVFSGMIPKKLTYLNNILCLYSQEYSYYDWSQKILYISKDVEVRDVLYNAISNNSIPFTSSDWSMLYYDNLVSKTEVESRDQEIENLRRELQEYIDKFGKLSKDKDVSNPNETKNPNDKDDTETKKDKDNDNDKTTDKTKDEDPTIKKGKDQEIPKSDQIAAQLEAQQFLMKEMPEWHYPLHYGEYNKEEGKPYYFSTVMLNDSQGKPILIVLKSYKKQDEPFKINPTEWESIIKESAYLLIYTGDDIKRITKEDLVKNQSKISLSFSTENLDIEDRISAFCSSLHYFKELHFDFKSFNLSESAESIKNIFKKNEGTQNSNTEEDL